MTLNRSRPRPYPVRALLGVVAAVMVPGCKGRQPTNEPPSETQAISSALTSSTCSFSVLKNVYDGPEWWGTITFKNLGPASASNFTVEFDVPAGVHCTAEPESIPTGATLSPLTTSGNPRRTVSNHCIFTWSGTTLASGATKTFNYSTDSQSFSAATNLTIADSVCGGGMPSCAPLDITHNSYNGGQWWGTITFKNAGQAPSSNRLVVEFDVPSGVHCTAEPDAVPQGATLSPLTSSGNPRRTLSNHCIFTWADTTALGAGASRTFNYSTDSQSFSSATKVVARDECVVQVIEQPIAADDPILTPEGVPPVEDNPIPPPDPIDYPDPMLGASDPEVNGQFTPEVDPELVVREIPLTP